MDANRPIKRHRPKEKRKTDQQSFLSNSSLNRTAPARLHSSISSLMLLSIMLCVAWVFLHSGELAKKLNTSKSNSKFTQNTLNESNGGQLPQLDPVRVGYIREGIYAGIYLKIKTLSLRPPIFEIPRFLSIQDINQMLELTYHSGMMPSQVLNEEGKLEDFKERDSDESAFIDWDDDKDHFITPYEVRNRLIDKSDLYFNEDDILQMFQSTGADTNGDGRLEMREFTKELEAKMIKHLFSFASSTPRTKSRNSMQAWVDHKKIPGLAERVSAVTGMPLNVVRGSEHLQVVRYSPGGHYHCHFDSMDIFEDEQLPCCLNGDRRPCRLCRYITVLYFLNNVIEGGETAFPMADNETFVDQKWSTVSRDLCDLSRHCYDSNLYVKPALGKAIIWYNHYRKRNTLGRLEKRSLHGGCDVIKGEKWIANNWINYWM